VSTCESTSTRSGALLDFLAAISSPLARPWSGLLRALAFLCVLRVRAFDFVFHRQNLNTEYTEKYENPERELD
jgi:hypothetical protein